jgi:hypothetical protein
MAYRADKSFLEDIKGKHLVESTNLLRRGLKSGLFKKGNYVLIGDQINSIEAPDNSDKTYALIIWKKDDINDKHFTNEKVVRSFYPISSFGSFNDFRLGD